MTFFGAIAINFNTRNPYLQEDYMDITVVKDWDVKNSGSYENIWDDIVASWPAVTIPVTAYDYTFNVTFQLIELDENGNFVDYSTVYYIFPNGVYANGDVVSGEGFFSAPTPGTIVKALIVNSYLEFSPMP